MSNNIFHLTKSFVTDNSDNKLYCTKKYISNGIFFIRKSLVTYSPKVAKDFVENIVPQDEDNFNKVLESLINNKKEKSINVNEFFTCSNQVYHDIYLYSSNYSFNRIKNCVDSEKVYLGVAKKYIKLANKLNLNVSVVVYYDNYNNINCYYKLYNKEKECVGVVMGAISPSDAKYKSIKEGVQ